MKKTLEMFKHAEVLNAKQLKDLKGGATFTCWCGNGGGFSANVDSVGELLGHVSDYCGSSGASCNAVESD